MTLFILRLRFTSEHPKSICQTPTASSPSEDVVYRHTQTSRHRQLHKHRETGQFLRLWGVIHCYFGSRCVVLTLGKKDWKLPHFSFDMVSDVGPTICQQTCDFLCHYELQWAVYGEICLSIYLSFSHYIVLSFCCSVIRSIYRSNEYRIL